MTAGNAVIGFEDAALVEQCRRGDLSAVGPFIEKYQDRVYNTCWRLCGNAEDAADLTQEAFVKAIEAIGQFDGRARFYTWVFRIAVNLAISHRRQRSRRRTVALHGIHRPDAADAAPPAEWLADDALGPEARAAQREEHARVLAAMETLDDEQRGVLVLRDIEQFDYAQIADILSIPVGTVKSKLHRARMALRDRLESSSAAG